MYPFFDPEGQLAAHEYFQRRMARDRGPGPSIFSILIAIVLVSAVRPAVAVTFTHEQTNFTCDDRIQDDDPDPLRGHANQSLLDQGCDQDSVLAEDSTLDDPSAGVS